jgi:hypothetical protein
MMDMDAMNQIQFEFGERKNRNAEIKIDTGRRKIESMAGLSDSETGHIFAPPAPKYAYSTLLFHVSVYLK